MDFQRQETVSETLSNWSYCSGVVGLFSLSARQQASTDNESPKNEPKIAVGTKRRCTADRVVQIHCVDLQVQTSQFCQYTAGLIITSGQSNLTTGRIAVAHGWFNGIKGTLAPPGEYDGTRASIGPPESTIQMVNRSVQLFLHNSRQKDPVLTMGSSLPPKNASAHRGSGPPSNTWFSGQPECPYTLQWDAPSSLKMATSHGAIWTSI